MITDYTKKIYTCHPPQVRGLITETKPPASLDCYQNGKPGAKYNIDSRIMLDVSEHIYYYMSK